MKPLVYILAVLAIAAGLAGPLLVRSQSPQSGRGVQISPRTPSLTASVERIGDQLRLVLTNPSETRTFQGVASISPEGSTGAAIRFSFTLAPAETRRLSLPASTLIGNQYALTVYDQARVVVLYKIAPPVVGESQMPERIPEQTAQVAVTSGIKVSARHLRTSVNREAELQLPDDAEPLRLTLVIESATPLKDANFTLSNRDFQRRQPVSVQCRAEIEFKLPEDVSERQFNYALHIMALAQSGTTAPTAATTSANEPPG